MSDVDGVRKIEYVPMDAIGRRTGLCCMQWKDDDKEGRRRDDSHFHYNNVEQRCGCPGGRPQTDCSQTIAAGNDEVGRLTLRQAGAHDLDGRYKR